VAELVRRVLQVRQGKEAYLVTVAHKDNKDNQAREEKEARPG